MISNAEYTPLYYLLISISTLLFSLPLLKISSEIRITKIFEHIGILVFLIISITFIGFRDPYDNDIYFGDTIRYTYFYENLNNITKYNDIGYFYYMYFFRNILNVSVVFFYVASAFFYVFFQYLAIKNLKLQNTLYPLIILVTTMSFWNYGVNGLRSGLASAFFLYGFTSKNKKIAIVFYFLCFFMHKSFLLLILAVFIVMLYGNVRFYIKIWLFTILISLAFGNNILQFISSNMSFLLSETDDRFNTYTSGTLGKGYFRIDFILYSLIPILLAYYFINNRKFSDIFYEKIFKIYLFCNCIWILLIYANFSNRFAYLSWILIPILLIYPLVKKVKLVKYQSFFVWCIIVVNLTFTLLMFFKN